MEVVLSAGVRKGLNRSVPDLCKLLCIVAKLKGSVKIATKAGVVRDCRSSQPESL